MWLPTGPEKTSSLPRGHHVVVQTHYVRKPHGSKRRSVLTRLQLFDDRSEIGPISRADLPRFTTRVRITSQDPIGAGIVQISVRTNRTHNSKLVGPRRNAR